VLSTVTKSVEIQRAVALLFNNSVRTAKKTQLFTITKINWLTLFKERIAVYSDNSYHQVLKS
jgi:hypothetical protein